MYTDVNLLESRGCSALLIEMEDGTFHLMNVINEYKDCIADDTIHANEIDAMQTWVHIADTV